MKMKQLIDAMPLLQTFLEEKVSRQERYDRQKLISAIEGELDYYNKEKLKIYEKHGEAHDDGTITLKGQHFFQAQKELNELNDIEIRSTIEKVKVNFPDDKKLSANDEYKLLPFVDFIYEKENNNTNVKD